MGANKAGVQTNYCLPDEWLFFFKLIFLFVFKASNSIIGTVDAGHPPLRYSGFDSGLGTFLARHT